jgi:hypothetical protein
MLEGYKHIDSINIEKVANGFVVTIEGRNTEDDWSNNKLVFIPLSDVIELLQEAY